MKLALFLEVFNSIIKLSEISTIVTSDQQILFIFMREQPKFFGLQEREYLQKLQF